MTVVLAAVAGFTVGVVVALTAAARIHQTHREATDRERERLAGIDTEELVLELAVAQADRGRWRRQALETQRVARNLAGLLVSGRPIPLGPPRRPRRTIQFGKWRHT